VRKKFQEVHSPVSGQGNMWKRLNQSKSFSRKAYLTKLLANRKIELIKAKQSKLKADAILSPEQFVKLQRYHTFVEDNRRRIKLLNYFRKRQLQEIERMCLSQLSFSARFSRWVRRHTTIFLHVAALGLGLWFIIDTTSMLSFFLLLASSLRLHGGYFDFFQYLAIVY
jgi:hypothetical protein